MDRLRDLATRSRRVDHHFRIPKSLSTTSLMLHKPTDPDHDSDEARSTVSSTSASASMAPQTLLPNGMGTAMPSPHSETAPVLTLPSPDTKRTPVQPRAQQAVPNSGKKKTSSVDRNEKQRRMKANKAGQGSLEGDDPFVAGPEADHKLFGQILTNIAQDDVIANSGLELYRRVNDCARDYMEAKQIVERKEHEIAAISTRIETIQATMDKASKHLHKAQAIAAEAIDSSVAEQFRLKEQENLTNILIGMTNAIAKGNCHIWPREKVNKCLEDLQCVFYKNKHYCQSSMVSSGIVHVAKHFVFHADYDDAFEPMLFHLANHADYEGFVERCRKEDHDFAQQHQVHYTTRPGFPAKTNTTAAPLGDEGLADRVEGCQSAGDSPCEGPDGAAGAAPAESHSFEQVPSQNSTALPPRSSSLPSFARKTLGSTSHHLGDQRYDAPSKPVFSNQHRDTAHIYKHFEFRPDADMNKMADKIRAQLESQPGLKSGTMQSAVLESIAGLEAIFKDGPDGAPPKVKQGAYSVMEHIERLNKDFVMSDQVTRKLGAMAEGQGFRSIQTHKLPDGRVQIDITTGACPEGCGCKKTKRDGLETNAAQGNSVTPHGEDVAASSGDSDQLWKDHHVSSLAPGDC